MSELITKFLKDHIDFAMVGTGATTLVIIGVLLAIFIYLGSGEDDDN